MFYPPKRSFFLSCVSLGLFLTTNLAFAFTYADLTFNVSNVRVAGCDSKVLYVTVKSNSQSKGWPNETYLIAPGGSKEININLIDLGLGTWEGEISFSYDYGPDKTKPENTYKFSLVTNTWVYSTWEKNSTIEPNPPIKNVAITWLKRPDKDRCSLYGPGYDHCDVSVNYELRPSPTP